MALLGRRVQVRRRIAQRLGAQRGARDGQLLVARTVGSHVLKRKTTLVSMGIDVTLSANSLFSSVSDCSNRQQKQQLAWPRCSGLFRQCSL
jgi:hypothetical protein